MTIAPFPHRYTVALENKWLLAPHRAPILGGVPPQFGGSDEVWSPEELLVGAALLCAKTTFESYAARAGIPVYSWSGNATGVLDRSATGPVFTSIVLEVDIESEPGLEAQIEELLRKVERTCIVARALNARVEILSTIRGHARAS
jgi:organic hydroperoxide reductase OsmC/OhrA